MILRSKLHSSFLSSIFRLSIKSSTSPYICNSCQQHRRTLHKHVQARKIPSPTPFVPDVSTFLSLIGRDLSQHSTKFKSWQDLFTLSSPQLKELGIEPPRTRKYLLRWREKFKNGEFGIGGDFKHVQDGIGELKVIEVPALKKEEENNDNTPEVATTSHVPGMKKLILNIPNGATSYTLNEGQKTEDLRKPRGLSLKNGHVIVGSYVQPVKGSNGSAAILKVQEGMWEDRRGHKVFGGERRRAETLHKMRVEERKKNAR